MWDGDEVIRKAAQQNGHKRSLGPNVTMSELMEMCFSLEFWLRETLILGAVIQLLKVD